MDDPSNWRGDQDIVDLESWRRAGLGEFVDEGERELEEPKLPRTREKIRDEEDELEGASTLCVSPSLRKKSTTSDGVVGVKVEK